MTTRSRLAATGRSGGLYLPVLIAFLLVCGVGVGGGVLRAAEGTVRDVTLLPHGNGVRIVVDLGRDVRFEHVTLDQPPRLAIDLPDVSWQLPTQLGEHAYRIIEGFHFGSLRNGVSRLVFDVDRPFEIARIFELPPTDSSGYRIVTDILPLPPGSVMRRQRHRPRLDIAGSEPPRPVPRPRLERRLVERDAVAAGHGSARWRGTSPGAIHVPALRPRLSIAKRMIVIDPGHGGIDPGASGRGGSFEKDIVLAMAQELRRQLIDTGRYDVILTREDDSFVRLRDRLQIARASAGHLFISLHADSLAKAAKVKGAAVYTLSDQATNEEAARLASSENLADVLGGIDLSHQEPIVTQILIDLAQRDANSKSLKIGELLVDELATVTPMLRKQRQQAGFVVLKSPDMPSTLVELGYLSNHEDESRLNDPDHIRHLAGAMIEAIDRYFGAEPS